MGLTTTEIPPVTIGARESLSSEAIRDEIAERYGAAFARAHEHLLKSDSSLNKTTIESVNTLNMKTGTIISVIYSDGTRPKQYVVMVGPLNQITVLSSGAPEAAPRDPITAS